MSARGGESAAGSTSKSQIDSESELMDKLKKLWKRVNVKNDKVLRNASSKQEEIIEHYAALRTKVDAQSEIMIEEIREWSESAREKINKHEKECLDKFNAEEFEASATEIKFLLEDILNLEDSIKQQLADAETNVQAAKKLIYTTKKKLDELSDCDTTLNKLKFPEGFLQLVVRDKNKFDLKRKATHELHNLPRLDCWQTVTTIRDMRCVRQLLYCFINPFAQSPELIAIVKFNSNKVVFMKMNTSGEILMEKKAASDYFVGVDTLQTVSDCFITQYGCEFSRFSYNFNVMKIVQRHDISEGFTANEKHIINLRIVNKYSEATNDVCFWSRDSTECHKSMSVDSDYGGHKMLASNQYLYLWNKSKKVVRIIDIDSQLAKEHVFDHHVFQDAKLVGDKYIATFNKKDRKVRLYTQDDQLEFIKEYKIPVSGDMSQDSSNGFCFFNHLTGLIHHNLF